MSQSAPITAPSSGYTDCLEAIRSRLAARESRLYGIAVLVVYVHQLERLFASAGHVNAARMLDELRNRLTHVSRPGDYFARLGDRKFVFVLSNLRNEGHALLAANKILRSGSEPLAAGGQQASVRLSIGIGMFPAHGRTPEQLMQCAEIALLEAWKSSQATVVYTARQADELVAGWDLETQLANALEHGDLVLNYQPKIALADMRIVGAEALMRWNRTDASNGPGTSNGPALDATSNHQVAAVVSAGRSTLTFDPTTSVAGYPEPDQCLSTIASPHVHPTGWTSDRPPGLSPQEFTCVKVEDLQRLP